MAREMGLAPDRVHRVSGMLLHPRFSRVRDAGMRNAVRDDLGISPEAFVLLVLFGGKGSAEMEPLCARLLA
ncbi:MAG: galactosyldiacylglycerol synthase, partial [Candidatus Eisenbacteria bacterium]